MEDVQLETVCPRRPVVAVGAPEGLLPRMGENMTGKIPGVSEGLVAVLAETDTIGGA